MERAQVEVALEYGWSCCPARVVDGATSPALHGVTELALARTRPVGVSGVVRRLAKRGVAQVRSPSLRISCKMHRSIYTHVAARVYWTPMDSSKDHR